MNEQIKELMKQAFQEHYGVPITPGARENAIELVSGWGEKFAELIVKECLGSLGSESEYGKTHIKKHFGVE